jgi:hypothetical protein
MLAGRFHVAGFPADVSHGAVRVIEVEVIATAGSVGPRAGPGDALAATAGTSDSLWRDQRANDSGLRRLTQIGWDRTGGRPMPRVALCGLNLAPGMAPMICSSCSNNFSELEPRYGIEP